VDEARDRWGDTEAYRESTRRLAGYTSEQKANAYSSQQVATQAVIDAKRAGFPATSEEAMAAAEECRLAIDTWFYPCDTAMHANLGEMYVSDDRFRDHYEQLEPGLAHYLHDAIMSNHHRAQ
jgi:hypothetical protein